MNASQPSSARDGQEVGEEKFCYSALFTSAWFGKYATVDNKDETASTESEQSSELKSLVCRDAYFLQSSRCKGDRVRSVSATFYARLRILTSFPYLAIFYVLIGIYVFLALTQYLRFNDKLYGSAIGQCIFMSMLPPLLTRLSTYSFCGDTSSKVPPLRNLLTLTPFWTVYFKAKENKSEPKKSRFLRQAKKIEMSACSVYELCDSIIAFTLKKRDAVMAGRSGPLANKIWAEIETDSGLFLLPYVLDSMTKLSLVISLLIFLYDVSKWFGPRRDIIYYVLDVLGFPVYAYFSWAVIPSILSFFLFTCHCHDFAISAFKRRILLDRLKDKSELIPPQWGAIPRAVVVNYTVTAPMITEASVQSRVNPHNEKILERLLESKVLGVGRLDHRHRKEKKRHSVAMTDPAHPSSPLFSPSGAHSAQSAVVVGVEIFEDVTVVLPEDVKDDRVQVQLARSRVDHLGLIFKKSVAWVLGVPISAVEITSVQTKVVGATTTGEIIGSVRDFNEEYLYHQAVIRRSSESWQLILVVSVFLLVAAIALNLASFFVLQRSVSLGLSVLFGTILIIIVMRMAVLNGKLASILTVLKEASSDDWPLYGGRGKILHDLSDNPIQFTLYGFPITYAWLLSLTTAVLSANLSVVLVIYSAALKEVNTASVSPGVAER